MFPLSPVYKSVKPYHRTAFSLFLQKPLENQKIANDVFGVPAVILDAVVKLLHHLLGESAVELFGALDMIEAFLNRIATADEADLVERKQLLVIHEPHDAVAEKPAANGADSERCFMNAFVMS